LETALHDTDKCFVVSDVRDYSKKTTVCILDTALNGKSF